MQKSGQRSCVKPWARSKDGLERSCLLCRGGKCGKRGQGLGEASRTSSQITAVLPSPRRSGSACVLWGQDESQGWCWRREGAQKGACCLNWTGGLGGPCSLKSSLSRAQTDAVRFLVHAFRSPIPSQASLWRWSRAFCRKGQNSSSSHGAEKQLPWGLGRDSCLRLGPVRRSVGESARIHI